MGHNDRADRRSGRRALNVGRPRPARPARRQTAAVPIAGTARGLLAAILALASLVAGPAAAEPPEPAALAPIFEGGIRKQRALSILPVLQLAPERRLSVVYTASNSYLNPGFLCSSGGDCPVEYETDHTGNLFHIDFSQPLGRAWEFGVGIGSYRLDDIADWALPQQLASDSALRNFHEDLLGEDSLPTLSGAPDGRQRFSYRDPAGRQLQLEEGHDYVLPLRVDFRRYFRFGRATDAAMVVKTGLHVAGPLGGQTTAPPGDAALVRGIDVGLSVDFLRSAQLSPTLSHSFYVQIARTRSDVHVADERSPQNADDPERSQYALFWGLRFGGTFGGRAACSFSLGQISNSAHYDKGTYWAWDPAVFEGGNNIRGALAGANDYGVLAFGCERRGRHYQLALVEDIGGVSQLFADGGAGTSYDPDFAVSLSASWRLGAGQSSD